MSSIATAKDGAADRTKLAILQAIGGPDMVDLVEMVGKVQLEAAAADENNGVVGVAADTYEQAIEKVRTGHRGQHEPGRVQAEALPADGKGGAEVKHMGAEGAEAGKEVHLAGQR